MFFKAIFLGLKNLNTEAFWILCKNCADWIFCCLSAPIFASGYVTIQNNCVYWRVYIPISTHANFSTGTRFLGPRGLATTTTSCHCCITGSRCSYPSGCLVESGPWEWGSSYRGRKVGARLPLYSGGLKYTARMYLGLPFTSVKTCQKILGLLWKLVSHEDWSEMLLTFWQS